MAYTYKKNHISTSKHSLKCPNAMTAQYITVHNTANDVPASNEISYMHSNDREVSFHIAVDDKEAVEGLPLNRNGWHSGDGHGDGNRKSIAIEICYSTDYGSKYDQSENNAIDLIVSMLKERGWGVDRILIRNLWSNKSQRRSTFYSHLHDHLYSANNCDPMAHLRLLLCHPQRYERTLHGHCCAYN